MECPVVLFLDRYQVNTQWFDSVMVVKGKRLVYLLIEQVDKESQPTAIEGMSPKIGAVVYGKVIQHIASQGGYILDLGNGILGYLAGNIGKNRGYAVGEYLVVQVIRLADDRKPVKVSDTIVLHRGGISLCCNYNKDIRSKTKHVQSVTDAVGTEDTSSISVSHTLDGSVDRAIIEYRIDLLLKVQHMCRRGYPRHELDSCVLIPGDSLCSRVVNAWGSSYAAHEAFPVADMAPDKVYVSDNLESIVCNLRPEWKHKIFISSDDVIEGYDLWTQLNELQYNKIQLECGGWYIIELTEALVSIDINSGSSWGRKAIYRTNMEAMQNIPMALWLRHLGGHIVIDPAGNSTAYEKKQYISTLKKNSNSTRDTKFSTTSSGLLTFVRSKRYLANSHDFYTNLVDRINIL